MPLVSNLDDNVAFRPANPRKSRKLFSIPVQYNAGTVADVFGDNRTDVPFMSQTTLAGLPTTPSLRSFARRPVGQPTNQPRPEGMFNNVPLKCDQFGSYSEGVSLFNAPYPEAELPLPAKPITVRTAVSRQFDPSGLANFDYGPVMNYELGIRPGKRPIRSADEFLTA